jgi:lysophospholipase L1-like esterase
VSWGRAAAWRCAGALWLALGATSAQACPPALAATFAAQAVDTDGLEALLAALREHGAAPDPACAPALGGVFVRARFGALPEDPDVFARALRQLQALPPEAQRAALTEGVAPALAAQVWGSLRRRALEPRLGPDHPAAALLRWPEAEPARFAALEAGAAAALTQAAEAHGPKLLVALSNEGGSVLGELARALEADILAAWLQSPHPAHRAEALTLAGGLGLSSPALVDALDAIVAARGPEAEAAAAARARLPPPAADPLRPPDLLPGQVAGAPLARLDGPPLPVAMPTPRRPLPLREAALALGCVGLLALTARLRRRALLPFAALAALALLELGLRAAGAPSTADHAPLFSFIPTGAQFWAPLPEAPGQLRSAGGSTRLRRIPATPAPGTRRIAALGESSVHGSHYLAEEAFPAQLEARLSQRLGAPVEVLNMGVGGSTSAGVLATGREALALGAELLIVYQGHNEVAQFTQLRSWTPSTRGLRLRAALHQSPLVALLRRALPAPAEAGPPPPAGPAAPPTRGEIDALHDLAVDHLRFNHARLIAEARAAGVPVLLCLPATNLAQAFAEPFPTPGPGDATDMDALYAAARAAAATGDRAAVEAALQARIDRSASPRELTTPAAATLRDLAADWGAPLVDMRAELLARSPDGFSQNGLYWDDLHPSVEGHRLIAAALEAPTLALLGGQATTGHGPPPR